MSTPTDDTRRLREDVSFAAEVIAAFLQMGVCPHGYDRDDLRTFQQRLEAVSVRSPEPQSMTPKPAHDCYEGADADGRCWCGGVAPNYPGVRSPELQQLCSVCYGNGVIKIHHGVSTCDHCGGSCYEPPSVRSPEPQHEHDEQRGDDDMPPGNWHAIEGPNGICACGPTEGCSVRLRRFIMMARVRSSEPCPRCAGLIPGKASTPHELATRLSALGNELNMLMSVRDMPDVDTTPIDEVIAHLSEPRK